MLETVIQIINGIRNNKDLPPLDNLNEGTNLREEIGFDSFDLAELTVRIEQVYAVDIFEDGIINTLGEILEKLKK